jgi:hypothetical protein
MATSAATAIAAMAARARREVREHFEERNAFDPAHAVTYDPPDRMHERQLKFLVRRGILSGTSDARHWMDREALRRDEERRRRAGMAALTIIAIAIAIVIAVVAIAAS